MHLDLQPGRRRPGGPPPGRVAGGGVGELLERSAPQLAERLGQARRSSPVQGMLRQPNQLRQAFGPGWALVGDAGYYRDAITAHGIGDAFRDAELLAVALDQALDGGAEETAALAAYQRQRDQALGEVFELTCRLAAYPPVPTFIELQKQFSAAIDTEAAALAARPVPGERLRATARSTAADRKEAPPRPQTTRPVRQHQSTHRQGGVPR